MHRPTSATFVERMSRPSFSASSANSCSLKKRALAATSSLSSLNAPKKHVQSASKKCERSISSIGIHHSATGRAFSIVNISCSRAALSFLSNTRIFIAISYTLKFRNNFNITLIYASYNHNPPHYNMYVS